MKAYGYSRADKRECKYGCCTFKAGKYRSCRELIDKTARKSARFEANKEIQKSM